MMTRLLIAVSLLLSGCGNETEPAGGRDLRGMWVVDAERTLVEIDTWPGSDAAKASARAFYSDESVAPEKLHLENGTLLSSNRPGTMGPVKGTWNIDSRDDDTWIVVIQRDDSVRPDRMVFTWIDDDHVKVVEEGAGDVLVFKRER